LPAVFRAARATNSQRNNFSFAAARSSIKLFFLNSQTPFPQFATTPLHLVPFPLDTTVTPAQQFRNVGRFLRALGLSRRAAQLRENRRCNTCPVSPFSALTRSVTFAVIGCAPTHPVPSTTTAGVPAVATFCAPFRRH
jgi:hypothetical protein